MTIRHAYLPTILISTLMTIACSTEHKPGYTADVRPILDKYCAECHMPDMEGATKSGFQIDSYASIMKGTRLGPVIVKAPTGKPMCRTGRVMAGNIPMESGHTRKRHRDWMMRLENWLKPSRSPDNGKIQ